MTMLYANSLARLYGAPGSGKSFVAMDMALSLAAGKSYLGRLLTPTPVVYVMAEGQAVNADRADAWMSKHHVTVEDVEDTFFAVPDAIQLTETGVKPFIEVIEPVKPALVILDTKNAMMVGEENSASDFAVMRRAMDMIRKTSDACVMLVDHTGYEGTRARGSSAATAGMDTEIRIEKDDSRPALVTAEVTRDKAAEAGSKWAWHLVPEHPAAVLVPTDIPDEPLIKPTVPGWMHLSEDDLPGWIRDQTNTKGKTHLVDLARLMVFRAREDPSDDGLTVAQATSELVKYCDYPRTSVGNAWSKLKNAGCLESYFATPTETQERSGPYRWVGQK